MATVIEHQQKREVAKGQWIFLGLTTALVSVLAVLGVEALALSIWPDLALFKPLDSFPRTALFTLVPALGATAVFAWLVAHKEGPVRRFTRIAAVVLLVSMIPDYILPVAHRTLLASTVTAVLHVVAAAITVSLLVAGYRRLSGT